MDFDLPKDLVDYLAELDAFIEAKIKPLQAQDDNERFFDHRREWARTDFDNGGLPRPEWEALLEKADYASLSHYRNLQDALQTPLGPGSRRLRGLLQRFEFAQALQVLRQLRAAQRENHGVDA